MADVQKYFRQFDDAIRFERDDEIAILVEKRERVLKRLSEGIKRQRRRNGKTIPSYESFNQGSYAMKTGVKPINGDFDIDVGLRFDLSKEEYPDPGVVKTWVHDAVKNHTKHVEMRRGCVTVFYQEDGEDIYHVDLVCYSSKTKNSGRQGPHGQGQARRMRLGAVRPAGAAGPHQRQILENQDAEQYRRAIRALKRWKDLRFSGYGRKAPKGIALTVAAYRLVRGLARRRTHSRARCSTTTSTRCGASSAGW